MCAKQPDNLKPPTQNPLISPKTHKDPLNPTHHLTAFTIAAQEF